MQIDPASGFVVEPYFHDGRFVGLVVHADSVEIFIKTEGGESYTLSLTGIRGFRATEILADNIVFSLNILSGKTPPPDVDLDDVHPGPHPTALQQYHDRHRSNRQEMLDQISKCELMLVWMDASYGATFTAVCKTVSIDATKSRDEVRY